MTKVVKASSVLNEKPPAGIRVKCEGCNSVLETSGYDECSVNPSYRDVVYSWGMRCSHCGRELRISGPGALEYTIRMKEQEESRKAGFWERIRLMLTRKPKALPRIPENEPCRFLEEINEAIEKLHHQLFKSQLELAELDSKNLLSDAGRRKVLASYIDSCKQQLVILSDLRIRQEQVIIKLAESAIPSLPTVDSLDLSLGEADDPVKKLERIVAAYEECAEATGEVKAISPADTQAALLTIG